MASFLNEVVLLYKFCIKVYKSLSNLFLMKGCRVANMVKRYSFEKESELLGNDFNNSIDIIGGKATGYDMLRKVVGESNYLPPLTTRNMVFTYHHNIDTSFYFRFEKIMDEKLKDPKSFAQEIGISPDKVNGGNDIFRFLREPEELKKVPEMVEIFSELMGNLERAFPEHVAFDAQAPSPFYAVSYHVRSSTTIEDFRDDRYKGTFKTVTRKPVLYGANKGFHYGEGDVIDMYVSFYAKKRHPKFELGKDDALALLVMPSLGNEDGYGTHLTVNTSFGNEPLVVIEAWHRMEGFNDSPQQLYFVKDGAVKVNQLRGGFGSRHYTDKSSPHKIEGEKSVLSIDELAQINEFARGWKTLLGYDVDLEILITNSERGPRDIWPLQIRPQMHKEISDLPVLADDEFLLARSPCVSGEFNLTAKLVMAEYKNDTYNLGEPAIMWHSESKKGYRLLGDKGVIGMLCPSEGSAITHGQEILPSFPFENVYKTLAIPGLDNILLSTMEEIQSEGTRGFRRTPFEITMGANGLVGEVIVNKKDAHYFTDKGFEPIDMTKGFVDVELSLEKLNDEAMRAEFDRISALWDKLDSGDSGELGEEGEKVVPPF